MYRPIYLPGFEKRLRQHGNIKDRVEKRVKEILEAPYDRTEALQEDLKGLRSARIGRNFRIIFVISEEIGRIAAARKKFPLYSCQPKDAVIFITISTHEKAYALR